jgi:predicted dienelactone hydrolase
MKRREGFLTSLLFSSPLVALALGCGGVAQSGKRSEAAPFSPPSGPFAVGTQEYLWIDQNRDEPFTKDPADRRHLLVRVWYPAEATPGEETARYVLDVNEYPETSVYRRGHHIKTNSVTGAPLARGDAPFPVLVYHHGGRTARFTGTFQVEELASHGYVIVSADHPGFSATVRFPDGYHLRPDTLLAPRKTGNFRDDVLRKWDWMNNDIFPTWIADASYTLDKIAELDGTPGQRFYRRLDLSRIGMLGWSFGGATSLQMSRNDPRVKAVVNQDGQLFGDVRDKGTSRPFMLMHHDTEHAQPRPEHASVMKELRAMVKAWNRSLLARSTSDRYEITIARTRHKHFSDLVLLSRRNSADLDPGRAHEIITAYTLAFFDKYLRAKDSPLLQGPSGQYPEVTFKKRKAGQCRRTHPRRSRR